MSSYESASIGLVSAFASADGVAAVDDLLAKHSVKETRAILGLSNYITSPAALQRAHQANWDVVVMPAEGRFFHPKFAIAGSHFTSDAHIEGGSWATIGSSNLTGSGLQDNVECNAILDDPTALRDASLIFQRLWNEGERLTPQVITDYANRFAEYARQRSPDFLALARQLAGPREAGGRQPRIRAPEIPEHTAKTVWASVESFTGEHTFQLEIPKRAAGALLHMLGRRQRSMRLSVQCRDDVSREVLFRWYEDNQMFRLNVPNDVPGVADARATREGILIVHQDADINQLTLEINLSGETRSEYRERSQLLGTFGTTTTREYGWF